MELIMEANDTTLLNDINKCNCRRVCIYMCTIRKRKELAIILISAFGRTPL